MLVYIYIYIYIYVYIYIYTYIYILPACRLFNIYPLVPIVWQEISLGEALTGFKICVTHLDGRKLMVSSKLGEVEKHRCTDHRQQTTHIHLGNNANTYVYIYMLHINRKVGSGVGALRGPAFEHGRFQCKIDFY